MNKIYLFILIIITISTQGCTSSCQKPDLVINKKPQIYPDYSEVTFPPNIAPPNFIIKEKKGDKYQTEIGCQNVEITFLSSEPEVIIDPDKWSEILKESLGKQIFVRITIFRDGKWTRYADIKNTISTEPINRYLTYRLLYPGYELWNEMGIYQRDLSTYEERPIAENKSFDKQCINCHTFNKNSPKTMMAHVRGKSGGTLIYKNGKVEKVNTKPKGFKNAGTYASWHPNGKFIAFSMNEIQQFFHSSGKKPIEVTDLASDLIVYDVEKNIVLTDSLIYGNKYMETFPCWSPDGKTIYFCRTIKKNSNVALDSIHYDLCKINFNPSTGKFDSLKEVYEASKIHKSISFPRISPDGKYLMFTISDYGNFSIWHPESELGIITLSNGSIRIMAEVNSNNVESFHSWSSNSKWFVFSSKRLDGLWARPFIASFDSKTGKAGKPFLLPQEDPHFYDTFTKTYNLPELINEPIKYGEMLVKAIKGKAKIAN